MKIPKLPPPQPLTETCYDQLVSESSDFKRGDV